MINKLCSRCGAVVPAGQPWQKHRAACYKRWRNTYGDGRPRHSSSAAWRRLRLAILERDGWVCQAVGCHEPAREVHHINGDWRNDDPSNLVATCRSHNPRVGPPLSG